jgi:hypothetical protein
MKRTEIFFVGLQAQRDEGDGRILLGDNTFGEAVTLRLIGLLCGVWISTRLSCIVYMYMYC